MPVVLDTPAEKPAVASKLFPLMWLYNTWFHCPSPTATKETGIEGEDPILVGNLKLEAFPMATDGELLVDQRINIETDELFLMVQDVPEAQAVMDAFLAAVPKCQAWIAARKVLREQQSQPQEEVPSE